MTWVDIDIRISQYIRLDRYVPSRVRFCHIRQCEYMEGEGLNVLALKAHLAINVRSVERSAAFYRKMFGIEPSKVRKGYAKFDLQNPPLNFTLNEVQFESSGALSHMGIQVSSTPEVLSVREQWARAGLITRDEMKTECCYASQDKTWVHDPDGNEWEVFVVLQDNLPELAVASAACCGPDCCSAE